MFFSERSHSTKYQLPESIQNVSEKNKFLRIKTRRSHVIQKLSTLNSNSNASNLVLLFPKLVKFFIESLQLVCKFLSSDHLVASARRWRVFLQLQLVHSTFAFSKSNDSISVSISSLVDDDFLIVCKRLKLSENLEFFGFPSFKFLSAQH